MIKSKKHLYKWMQTFLIIVIAISTLLIIMINWMLLEFKKDCKNLNYHMISIVQSSIDIRLKDISDFMSQLERSNTNLLLSNAETIDTVDSNKIYLFKEQLSDFKRSNAFIDDVFIYYPKHDYVIGDKGNFLSKYYYLISNGLKEEGYRKWLDFIQKKRYDMSDLLDENGEVNLYFFRQIQRDDEVKSILILKIKKEEVLRILGYDEFIIPSSLTAVVGKNNSLYTYYGNEESLRVLDSLSPSDYLNNIVEAGDYWCAIKGSDYFDLRYVTLVKEKDIVGSLYTIRNLSYLFLLVSMLLGVGLFAILGKRNNKPLYDLMNKLQPEIPLPLKKSKNEYELINSKIDSMFENETKHSEKLEKQNSLIEGMFLIQLLSSEEHNNAMIFASMQKCNIQLEFPLYQIVIIRKKNEYDSNESDILIERIQEHFSQMELDINCIGTVYNNDLVLLFNMEQDTTMERMKCYMEELQKSLLEKCRISLGGIYDAMSQIVSSYHQALMRLDTEESSITSYDKTVVYNNSTDTNKSGVMAEYEMYMLEGNYEEGRKRIDNLWNHYIKNDKYSYTARCKKYAVINPLIEAMIKVSEEHREFDREGYYQKLSSTKDQQKLLEIIHNILDEVILLSKKERAEKKEHIAEKAKDYIEQNYFNPMLGLYSISEYLGITNTYLSATFKKKYQMGVVQYINQLRIEKSKILLTNTEYSLKEIAEKVGFTNDVTFIRVFKQFENVTPGKYRKK